MSANRNRVVAAVLAGLLVVAAAVIGVLVLRPHGLTPAQRAAQAARAEQARLRRLLGAETKAANRAGSDLTVGLPTRTGQAAPTPTGALFKVPLPSHEVVGFVPYYQVDDLDPADYADTSELVYSSICIAANGGVSMTAGQCQKGWAGLSSAPFVALVSAAHEKGDRVLLSVSDFDEQEIVNLVKDPQPNAARLAAVVAPLEEADHLDGVDLDVEGTSAAASGGYVAFATAFARDFRATDPSGTLLINAYAGSASGSSNFYDVPKLARVADAIFVMAYDMDSSAMASASAPLKSSDLGYSVVQTLMQYEHVVPADKLILGVPFYGNDFSTVSAVPGARAAAPDPTAFAYQAIIAAGYAPLWDPASETPYSVFRRAGVWHQIWFDDPVSIALKTALANQFHTLGVGVWALGMEGDNSEMLLALTGGSPPRRTAPAAGAS